MTNSDSATLFSGRQRSQDRLLMPTTAFALLVLEMTNSDSAILLRGGSGRKIVCSCPTHIFALSQKRTHSCAYIAHTHSRIICATLYPTCVTDVLDGRVCFLGVSMFPAALIPQCTRKLRDGKEPQNMHTLFSALSCAHILHNLQHFILRDDRRARRKSLLSWGLGNPAALMPQRTRKSRDSRTATCTTISALSVRTHLA